MNGFSVTALQRSKSLLNGCGDGRELHTIFPTFKSNSKVTARWRTAMFMLGTNVLMDRLQLSLVSIKTDSCMSIRIGVSLSGVW
jgi:hypothetical protein